MFCTVQTLCEIHLSLLKKQFCNWLVTWASFAAVLAVLMACGSRVMNLETQPHSEGIQTIYISHNEPSVASFSFWLSFHIWVPLICDLKVIPPSYKYWLLLYNAITTCCAASIQMEVCQNIHNHIACQRASLGKYKLFPSQIPLLFVVIADVVHWWGFIEWWGL